MNREVALKAIEWLELLMYDGEYGTCGGCMSKTHFGGTPDPHEDHCELKATVDALKTAAGQDGEDHER